MQPCSWPMLCVQALRVQQQSQAVSLTTENSYNWGYGDLLEHARCAQATAINRFECCRHSGAPPHFGDRSRAQRATGMAPSAPELAPPASGLPIPVQRRAVSTDIVDVRSRYLYTHVGDTLKPLHGLFAVSGRTASFPRVGGTQTGQCKWDKSRVGRARLQLSVSSGVPVTR